MYINKIPNTSHGILLKSCVTPALQKGYEAAWKCCKRSFLDCVRKMANKVRWALIDDGFLEEGTTILEINDMLDKALKRKGKKHHSSRYEIPNHHIPHHRIEDHYIPNHDIPNHNISVPSLFSI